MGLEHVEAGEQVRQVSSDDVFEEHEVGVAHQDEPREQRRNLDPREVLTVGLAVTEHDREVE